jgi:hypothetical protein
MLLEAFIHGLGASPETAGQSSRKVSNLFRHDRRTEQTSGILTFSNYAL